MRPTSLELSRYVVLNPVRAGLARRPDEWPWSSYQATVGLDGVPEFLTVNGVLDLFGGGRHGSREVCAVRGRGDRPAFLGRAVPRPVAPAGSLQTCPDQTRLGSDPMRLARAANGPDQARMLAARGLDLRVPVELRVQFRAEQDGPRRVVEPEQQDDPAWPARRTSSCTSSRTTYRARTNPLSASHMSATRHGPRRDPAPAPLVGVRREVVDQREQKAAPRRTRSASGECSRPR